MRKIASALISPVVPCLLSMLVLVSCSSRTILPSGQDSVSSNDGDITVWFVKPDGTESTLVAAHRSRRSADQLESAVSELLAGPNHKESSDGLGTEIPRGTILLGIKQQGQDVELNLSRRFASGGGTSSWETRLEQLRKTVQAAAGQRSVYLDIEGKRLSTTSGEGLEIRQPINQSSNVQSASTGDSL